jgi:signal transduction histidine kinase
VETFEDISQLQQLSKQASRVGTLTALGEMAGTVAHEIRNPLGGIGGFAGLLERDLDVEDSRRRLVKKIIEGVDSLNRMVTNLLNYTRPVQLNIRPADLVQVVEDSLGFFEIDAGNRLEQIELQRAYEREELVCRIDPEQIQQMVLNLLHNAVQAMPSGGELRVGLTEADAGDDERTELSGTCMVLTVTDTGVGMTEEVKSKLFMPFFTTKEDGNGLGLATAKKFVDALGGDVAVESEPDQGSAFTIYFPK